METILDFNNREIAILLLFNVLLIFLLTQKKILEIIIPVFQAVNNFVVWGPLLGGVLWSSLLVWWLQKFNLWGLENVKTTVIWIVTFAFYSMYQANEIQFDRKYGIKLTKESFGLAAILLFIGNVYTFDLWIELILIPLVTILTILQLFSKNKPENEIAHKLCANAAAIIGFAYLIHWSIGIYKNPEWLFTVPNFVDFSLPILLTFWYLPYLFAWKLLLTYERLFVALRRNIKDPEVLGYAKRSSLLRLRWNFRAIRRFTNRIAVRDLSTKFDVMKHIYWAKLVDYRDKFLTVDSVDGWAPSNAMQFLSDFDMVIKNYIDPVEDEWYGAAYKTLKVAGPYTSLEYAIEGTQAHVKALKLSMSVYSDEGKEVSEFEYITLATRLFFLAVDEVTKEFITPLTLLDPFEGSHKQANYKLTRSQWQGPNHLISDYELLISLVKQEESIRKLSDVDDQSA